MTRWVVALAVMLLSAAATEARAQGAPLDREELTRFTRAHIAIGVARDEFHARIARIHDDVGLARARQEMDARLLEILQENGLTSERWGEIILLISQDAQIRATFEEISRQLRAAEPG
jgi:hypothetical protein